MLPFLVGQVAWIAQMAAHVTSTSFRRPHQAAPSNQAAFLESQMIHLIQQLNGQTLRNFERPDDKSDTALNNRFNLELTVYQLIRQQAYTSFDLNFL